jgi:hypothetical protein
VSENPQIKNDSIALNNLMIERCNVKREDLLNTQHFGKVTFILENGMIEGYEFHKKRRVKR